MWKVSKLQGIKNKWAVSFCDTLRGFATVSDDGQVSGNIQMLGITDTFKAMDEIQELIADEIMEEQLLMSN
jgi:hypothetical protein